MPNPTLPVNISVNFQPTTPQWTVAPDQLIVAHGQVDTIQWNLTCQNVPSGAAKAAFALSNAIQFVPGKPGLTGDTWGGGVPTRASDTQVTVSDDNTAAGTTKHYYYSITVATFDANGNQIQTYTKDPEVENPGN